MRSRNPTGGKLKMDLQQEEIEAHRLLTQSMNMLNSRIERTESDFVGHLKKVEDRLDQIVDLTKTVAVLQNQGAQQMDQITEVRNQLRDYSAKFDNSISRIHTRLDDVTSHNRDKLELHSKEFEMSVKAVKALADNTDKELKQWLNRGWGMWIIFVLVVGVAQALIYRWIDSVDKEKTLVVQTVQNHTSTLDKQTQALESLAQGQKEQALSLKRLDQMIQDSDKQLEILRNYNKR